MRRLLVHTVHVLVLVAFSLGSGGWVLHRHWCPEAERQVLSVAGPAECASERMARAAEPSCCQAPAPAAMACGESEGCCHDAVGVWPPLDPYTLAGMADVPVPAALALVLMPARTAGMAGPEAPHAAPAPDPPPPRRALDRLNVLQVYRT